MPEFYSEYHDAFEQIEKTFLQDKFPHLKTALTSAEKHLRTLINMLLRKSFLIEDYWEPPQNDIRNFFMETREISLPQSDYSPELSHRLKRLVNLLSYLAEYMPRSIQNSENSNFSQQCRKVLDYFPFHDMDTPATATQENKRALKPILARVPTIGDTNYRIDVEKEFKDLVEEYQTMHEYVCELEGFEAELYKAKIRFDFMPTLEKEITDGKKMFLEDRQTFLLKAENCAKEHDFVLDCGVCSFSSAVEEYYNKDVLENIQRILYAYLSSEEYENGLEHTLLKAELVRIICEFSTVSKILSTIYDGLKFNLKLLLSQKDTLFSKLGDFMKSPKYPLDEVTIDYMHPKEKIRIHETINVNNFLEREIMTQINAFIDFGHPETKTYNQINSASPKELWHIAEDAYSQVTLLSIRISSVDLELRGYADEKIRQKMLQLQNDTQELDITANLIKKKMKEFSLAHENFLPIIKVKIPKKKKQ